MGQRDDFWDSLWINARLATMTAGGDAYGAVEGAALAVADGRITWLGPIPAMIPSLPPLALRVTADRRAFNCVYRARVEKNKLEGTAITG